MPKLTIDCKGEVIKAPILPEGWYEVFVDEIPKIETGKESGKKYLSWIVKVKSGKFAMSPLKINTTLDKGDDPTKSKRWLLHQALAACGIEKTDDKYTFDIADLQGKEFYVKVVVKEESYNGNLFEKNEIKQIAKEPIQPKIKQTDPVFTESGDDEIPF